MQIRARCPGVGIPGDAGWQREQARPSDVRGCGRRERWEGAAVGRPGPGPRPARRPPRGAAAAARWQRCPGGAERAEAGGGESPGRARPPRFPSSDTRTARFSPVQRGCAAGWESFPRVPLRRTLDCVKSHYCSTQVNCSWMTVIEMAAVSCSASITTSAPLQPAAGM